MVSVSLEIVHLADEQWGLFTTAQARNLGVSGQRLASLAAQGALARMAHGVYRVSGTAPSPLDDLRAAWLALDPSRRAAERTRDHEPAVVSHRSAAALHKLGDVDADIFEFTVTKRKQARRADIQFHRGRINAEDWTIVDGLPVTTVLRTIDDLAAARLDGGHLASVVRDALIQHQIDDQRLTDILRRHAHHYGAPLGDGQALLTIFLRQAGVSVPVVRGVDLSGLSDNPANMKAVIHMQAAIQHISEQLESMQRAAIPALRLMAELKAVPSLYMSDEVRQAIDRSYAPIMQDIAETAHKAALPADQIAEAIRSVVPTVDIDVPKIAGKAAREDNRK